jgi:hypothetical protein
MPLITGSRTEYEAVELLVWDIPGDSRNSDALYFVIQPDHCDVREAICRSSGVGEPPLRYYVAGNLPIKTFKPEQDFAAGQRCGSWPAEPEVIADDVRAGECNVGPDQERGARQCAVGTVGPEPSNNAPRASRACHRLTLPLEGNFQVRIDSAFNQDDPCLAANAHPEFDRCFLAALGHRGEFLDCMVGEFGDLCAAELHEADYTPWEGRDLAAWPSLVMLRGKIVVEGVAFKGDLKDGQFLARRVPEEVRTRSGV